MTPPTGVARLLSLATVASLLAPLVSSSEEARDQIRQAIQRDLPRYDPAIHKKAIADQTGGAKKMTESPAPVGKEPPTPKAARPTSVTDGALELPTVTVHPTYTPPKRLPRIDAPKPVRDLPGEPFESAKGREARLLKKHLSPLERALAKIPLLGPGIVGSAHEAEAREQKARQMSELADGIELQELLGRDPKEIKQLRGEYEKLYYSGPKR
jgi:hypothetical protein